MNTQGQPKARLVATFQASVQVSGDYDSVMHTIVKSVGDAMTCEDLMRWYESTSKRFLGVGQLQLTREIQQ